MSQKNPMRRILGSFGADSSIEGIDIDISVPDVALLFGTVLAGIFVFDLAGLPGLWAVQLVGVLVALLLPITAGVLIFVTPTGETSTVSWVAQMFTFWRQDNERSIVDALPDNRTETLTQVSRFHPDTNAVERTDGDLVGGVRVEPANMSLATKEEWETAADELGDALNSLGFGVFIHSTGRHIDDEAIVGAYDDRETDPDVMDNPTLRDLVEMYQTHLRDEFASGVRDTSVREYYILVSVGERDVQLATYGAFEKLTDLPAVGDVIKTLCGAAAQMSIAETHAEQAQELSSRIEDVEDAMQGVPDCSTEVLGAQDLAGAIEEFWTGERSEFADGDQQMRSIPVVVSETNEEVRG